MVDLNDKSIYLFNKYFVLPVLSLNTSVSNLDSTVNTFTNLSSVIANASSIKILNASVLLNTSSITTLNASLSSYIINFSESNSSIIYTITNINTSVRGINTSVSNLNTSVSNLNTSVSNLNTSLITTIDSASSTSLSIGGTNGTSTQSYAGAITSGTLNIATGITTGNINIGSVNASKQVNIGGILIGGNSINISNTSLQIGNNASNIVIGPLSQTASLNISTVVNGVRIDSHTTNNNLFLSFGNTSYKVASTGAGLNVCNTAVSNLAFSVNPMTGDHCTAVGHNCLTKNSTGKYNIAIGADTLENITTGNYNTALGGRALNAATTNTSQVAIGYNALASSVTSTYANVAVGYGALQNYNNSSSGANVAVGYLSLGSLTTGEGNVAIGYLADNAPGYTKNTTSNGNICIGNQATSNGFSNCIAIGQGANNNANDQIIIGAGGGSHTTWIQGTGGFNVNAGPTNLRTTTIYEATGTGDAGATSGSLTISHGNNGGVSSIIFPSKNNYGGDYGYIRYRDDVNNYGAGYESARLEIGLENDNGADNLILQKGGGYVGIGTSSPGAVLDIAGDQKISGGIRITGQLSTQGVLTTSGGTRYNNSGSTIVVGNDNWPGSFTSGIWSIFCPSGGNGRVHCGELWMSSDERIKKNIKDIEDDIALEHLRNIQPKIFNYIDNVLNDTRPMYGFIAQDLENNIPYSVTHSTNIIPNIFEMSDVSNGNIVTLRTKDTALFNANEYGKDTSGNAVKINVYDKNDKQHTTTITRIIDNKSFEIKDKFTDATLFIYGQEINDFKVIQKDAIYTITVAALQQIDREYQVTKQEVKELKTIVQQQQSQIDALIARLNSLENKIS